MEGQDQVPMSTVECYDDGEEATLQDAAAGSDEFAHFTGLVKVGEETREYGRMKRAFLAGMKNHAIDTLVLAIYKNSGSSFPMAARFASFKAFEQVVSRKNGGQGNENIMYGWYGGTKEEITQIVSYGFGRCNGHSHGVGVYLSSTDFLVEGLDSAIPDEDDMRHVLLCKVIMGKMEVIPAGSKQRYPSSEEFDSGVDNLKAPKKLIIWTPFMNSHILPDYIISFKAPSSTILLMNRIREIRNVTFVSLPALHSTMVEFLGPAKGALISSTYGDYIKHKVNAVQLFQTVRQTTGDDQLLLEIFIQTAKKCVLRASRRTCAAQAAAALRRR